MLNITVDRWSNFLLMYGHETLQSSGKHTATLWDKVSLTLLVFNFISFTQIVI